MDIMAKYHHVLMWINGIGAQVKNTVTSKKNFRPHTSDKAPTSGALKNDNNPYEEKKKKLVQNPKCKENKWRGRKSTRKN